MELGLILSMTFMAVIVIIVIVVIFWEVISDKLDEKKYSLKSMNALRECPRCGFYHRKYQRIMKSYSDENYKQVVSGKYYFKDGKLEVVDYYYDSNEYACPHCLHWTTDRVEKEFGWEKNHMDCGEITRKGLRHFDKTLSELNRLSYEQKTLSYMQKKEVD